MATGTKRTGENIWNCECGARWFEIADATHPPTCPDCGSTEYIGVAVAASRVRRDGFEPYRLANPYWKARANTQLREEANNNFRIRNRLN